MEIAGLKVTIVSTNSSRLSDSVEKFAARVRTSAPHDFCKTSVQVSNMFEF